MVIAVVPQMNACAPKTKNTGIATYGAGGQREGEVGQRLDDQPDLHQAGQADVPGDPAVRQRAEHAPARTDRRDQAEAHRAEPEPLARVDHQHRPRGTPGDVEDEDRQHQRADRGVVPRPADPLDDVVPDQGRRRVRVAAVRRQRHPGDAADREQHHDALRDEGHAIPAANRKAPIGGPTSWLSVMKPTWSRDCARPMSSRAPASARRCSRCCPRTPRRCRAGTSPTSTSQIETVPVDDRARRAAPGRRRAGGRR